MELQLELIPPAVEVRRKLAANLRERRLLRSLYRLASRAEEERREHERIFPRPAAAAGDRRA